LKEGRFKERRKALARLKKEKPQEGCGEGKLKMQLQEGKSDQSQDEASGMLWGVSGPRRRKV